MIISKLPKGGINQETPIVEIIKILTINGAVGETITITGDGFSENVILNDVGTANYGLILIQDETKTLKFTGSISSYSVTKSISGENAEVVNVMPEGAAIWYGLNTQLCGNIVTSDSLGPFYNFSNVAYASLTSPKAIFNGNVLSISYTPRHSSATYVKSAVYFDKPIDISNFTKLRVIGGEKTATSGSSILFEICGVSPSLDSDAKCDAPTKPNVINGNLNTGYNNDITVDISSISQEEYLIISATILGRTNNYTNNIKAIWFE